MYLVWAQVPQDDNLPFHVFSDTHDWFPLVVVDQLSLAELICDALEDARPFDDVNVFWNPIEDYTPQRWIRHVVDASRWSSRRFCNSVRRDDVCALAGLARKIVEVFPLSGLKLQDDTKNDTRKKGGKASQKKRVHNEASLECVRRFKRERQKDPSISMKSIVEDYAVETGTSADSVMRRLNDNSADWKKAT